MGHGSYTAADWTRLRTSKKMDTTSGEKEIFVRRGIDPRFDPRFINIREARDSDDHPHSTPIIIGLDVTASMGYLSNTIARGALNETMLKLYSTKPVEDPAIMFAAYGDFRDKAPLQVTQFESDIRITEQLMDLWLESNGSGYVVTNLLWYFAAMYTDTDSFTKRGQKGFIFTIGDNADCRTQISSIEVAAENAFGQKISMTADNMLKEAQKKYEVFHINIGCASPVFNELLPGRTIVIKKDEVDNLPEIIISAMQMTGGKGIDEIIAQWPNMEQPSIRGSIQNLTCGSSANGFTF